MRRRGRGNNRKPGGGHHHHHQGRNQTFDSNGPGVRLRGTAHQIYEKYLTLARDASASGDRIMAENYFQHADHYYRIILVNQGPLEQFVERADPLGEDLGELQTFGQGDQPSFGDIQPQAQPVQNNTLPANQGFNGSGASQGTSLPGNAQPRAEGDAAASQPAQGAGQGQSGFRRDRFNRRFRDRNDRQSGERQAGGNGEANGERRETREPREGQEGREHRERSREGREREGREREGREDRPRRERHTSNEDAFEPPAFLKAERPSSESPRDPFGRDED